MRIKKTFWISISLLILGYLILTSKIIKAAEKDKVYKPTWESLAKKDAAP